MVVDFLHNKIVAETASESFKLSVEKNLIPMIEAKLGGIDLFQMYEDYIKDDFSDGGYWYYPFSAVKDGICHTVWCKWDVSDKLSFDGGNPYAFVGDELRFFFADDVPQRFIDTLAARSRVFIDDAVKLNIHSSDSSFAFLSGRYSQSFVDEMCRQLTSEIEKEAGVRGIAQSSVELDIVFAPETYMEHISENVTYRRLLLTAKGCAPRDLWVKWTRLSPGRAYSVSDHVFGGDIRFEIAEDVSHKIREKEYRFLVFGNSDKYRNAMGRKNITEWRELIKRALKRGELEKCESYVEMQEHANEINDKLSEILARSGIVVPEVEEIEEAPRSAEFEEAMRIAASAAASRTEQIDTGFPDGGADTAQTDISDTAEEQEPNTDGEDDISDFIDLPFGDDALEELDAPAPAEPYTDIPKTEVAEVFVQDEPAVQNTPEVSLSVEDDEKYKNLLAQLQELRDELERVNLECGILKDKLADSERQRIERERELREQIELEIKKNEREKSLFADAIRLAKEEEERKAREQREKEREERELEERRLAYEREREELERAEAERAAEVARIERERIIAQREKEEEERRAREAELARAAIEERRIRNEELARRMAERMMREDYSHPAQPSRTTEQPVGQPIQPMAETVQQPAQNIEEAPHKPAQAELGAAAVTSASDLEHVKNAPTVPVADVKFTQKYVRLMFRHNVDPNVTQRIKEMIAIALDSLGKAHVFIKIKASVPELNSVLLNFVKIPEDEMQTLVDIIHILGNSDLGVTKIIME